jgi:hypothetical protein
MAIHLVSTREWVESGVMKIISGVVGSECSTENVEDRLVFIDSRPYMCKEICDRIEDQFCLHDLQSRMRRLSFPQLVDLIVTEFGPEEVEA